MRIRYTERPTIEGFATTFNTHGVGEVIAGFDDGEMTSEAISELDIQLASGEWLPMREAFRARLIMGDNYDEHFGEPTDEERERGWIR
jgi:hypothetical protein